MAKEREKHVLQNVLGGFRAEAERAHIAPQPRRTLVEERQDFRLHGARRRGSRPRAVRRSRCRCRATASGRCTSCSLDDDMASRSCPSILPASRARGPSRAAQKKREQIGPAGITKWMVCTGRRAVRETSVSRWSPTTCADVIVSPASLPPLSSPSPDRRRSRGPRPRRSPRAAGGNPDSGCPADHLHRHRHRNGAAAGRRIAASRRFRRRFRPRPTATSPRAARSTCPTS